MPKINTHGIDLHYQQTGRGPDVVMVHGLGANVAFWYLRIAPLLADRYRLTMFDLRGHGLSAMPHAGYTTRHLAEDLAGLIDDLGLGPAHLVGHSLGGAVSLHCAILHPQHVRSIALVDCRIHSLQPLINPDDDEYWRQQRRKLEARGIEVPDDTPRVVYRMLDELAPLAGVDGDEADETAGLLITRGLYDANSRAARQWRKLLTTTTFPQEVRTEAGLTVQAIRQVRQPTLLSFGGNSFCLETCRELEQLLPDCRTVIHPGLGHFYPVVQPAVVADDVHGFISSLNGVAAHAGDAGDETREPAGWPARQE